MSKNNVNLEEIISKVTKEAIKEYDKEKRMEQRDRRLHNTRLLMKHYNTLKTHIDSVRDDVGFDIEDAEDKVWLTSLVRTKLRTMKMMACIDSALSIIEENMRKDCIEHKYRAFELYYIEKRTNEEIITMLGCGKNQPKIWSDIVVEELSLLLWGIEALGM